MQGTTAMFEMLVRAAQPEGKAKNVKNLNSSVFWFFPSFSFFFLETGDTVH